ncbi:ABC transporter B family member 11 [Phytophthora nicotianae]|uniref:Kinesin-like protein n=1 Tax=Phytophthora nicotianae TaxID=4792 RepID=A0A0W8D5H1_PHYNI|nr:ABC transporter B family member 11 [Phytophthora nicotianae]
MLKRSSVRATDEDAPCAIKVVVRARPLNERELQAKTSVVVSVSRTGVQVVNPIVFADPSILEAAGSSGTSLALSPAIITAATTTGECRTFHFDRCFGSSDQIDVDEETQRPNQELIFDEIGQSVIESAFQGFNCTMFAYGQTGSGKTHTMVGDKTVTGKGVIPRVCEALFQEIDSRREKEALSQEQNGDSGVKRTIYTAHTSKISMIDLAGSERANVSGTSGDRLKEGAMINKSLTTLGRVISALSKQAADRIPYRDSTLTWLLKESLGGNAKSTQDQDVASEENSLEYIVEVESLDPTAILLVNGEPLEYGSEHPVRLHHGDQVRLGKPYCFRIHEAVEQPPELEIDKDESRELEVLVEEANAICTKWLLNTEFSVAKEEKPGTVIVKKKLEAQCCSTVHWDRTMLELKLQFLREFAASLENVVSFTVEETPKIEDLQDLQIAEPSPKVAASRRPSGLSELERKPSYTEEQHKKAEKTQHKPQVQTTPSLRLLGYGRLHLAAQSPGSSVSLSVAIYDFTAAFIGNLETQLEGISEAGKKRGILSPKEPTTSIHRIRVHLGKMKFDAGTFVSASNISITLKETTTKAHLKNPENKESSEEGHAPKIFSTPRVPPMQTSNNDSESTERDQKTFLINENFETAITAKKKQLFNQHTAEEESLLVEVWGYDVKTRYLAPPTDEVKDATMEFQQVEFYVSVDVEEREVDGLYHSVAVKPDGALRLHANRLDDS